MNEKPPTEVNTYIERGGSVATPFLALHLPPLSAIGFLPEY